MADNVEANAGSGGAIFATALGTWSGDATANFPGCFLAIVSGSEGSWTFSTVVGGAGAVAAGVQRVTLASDDPAVVDLAAIEVLLGTIDADTGGILTSVQLIDDAIYTDGSGTPSKGIAVMGTDGTNPQLVSTNSSGHVNVINSGTFAVQADTELPAAAALNDATANPTVPGVGAFLHVWNGVTWDRLLGDQANGVTVNLATNNDVTISGGVAVSSVVPGTGATNLGKAEDAAHSSTDVGVYVLAVRDDSLAAHSGTDGDYESLHTNANGALWTIDVNSATVSTNIATVAGAVSGTEMQVDVVAALPAGTNNIGDVDVLSVITGTGATNLGKAVDSAAGATDTGVAVLAVRDDALGALTPAEGDYVPLRVSSTGALHVTGGGGGTQYNVDDAAGGTDTGTLLLAIRDDSLDTLTPVDGDYVGLRVSSTGALHVTGGGGGTEYNEDAATPATITGTATMMERDDALGGLTPVEGDWAAMRCDANGALWVTVSGTVTVASHAVTNAGTFVVQENGAALTALQLIDNTVYVDDADWTATSSSHNLIGGVYQSTPGAITDGDTGPLRLTENGAAHVAVQGTVTVASHAVTNAGTFAVQVDGAALTALQLIDDAVFAEDVAAQAADKGVAILAVRRDADTSLVGTDNDYANLQVDANGYLKVEIFDGGGSHTVDNAGTFAVQVDGSALTALQLIDNIVHVDDVAFTLGTHSGVMAMGFAGTQSVDANDAAALSCTTAGQLLTIPQAHTSGGCSIFRSIDIDETEEEVKATAGQVYGIFAMNTTAAPLYLKLYNLTAANTSVGSSTPVMTLVVPGNGDSDGAGFYMPFPVGVVFDTAISVACTTAVADADTGAPGANACLVHIFYK